MRLGRVARNQGQTTLLRAGPDGRGLRGQEPSSAECFLALQNREDCRAVKAAQQSGAQAEAAALPQRLLANFLCAETETEFERGTEEYRKAED